MKLLRREKREPRVDFCDRCARVCDERCCADAVRERTRLAAVQHRFGI